MHARNAWLDGLSPSENRDIPPLRYEVVHALKHSYPDLRVVINGGIRGFAAIEEHLRHVDGVMLGREAYYNPMSLADVDQRLFGEPSAAPAAVDVARAYTDYMAVELRRGTPLRIMTQHLIPLFQNVSGARRWRRTLSEETRRPDSGLEVVEAALAAVLSPSRMAA